MIFYGTKSNNGMVFENHKKLYQYLDSLKDGQKLRIKVEPYRQSRSIQQNKLYWSWVNIIADSLGYDPEELHVSLRGRFLTDRSKSIPIIRSTTMLDTLAFTKYLNSIERLAGELGIVLPQPEEI